jgi:hypothetical protein
MWPIATCRPFEPTLNSTTHPQLRFAPVSELEACGHFARELLRLEAAECPEQRGKVERGWRHRIDEEEFWAPFVGDNFAEAITALAQWSHRYNHERFSMAVGSRSGMSEPPRLQSTPCRRTTVGG